MSVVLVLVSAVVAAALGLLAPRVLRRHPDAIVGKDAEPVSYAVVADSPGLALRVAVLSAVVAAVLAWRYEHTLTVALAYLVPLAPVCVLCAIVDFRTRTLPRWIVNGSLAYVLVVVLLAGVLGDLRHALVVGVVGAVALRSFFWVSWALFRTPGFGDVRLSAVLGLALGFLGVAPLLVGVFAMFFVGALLMLVLTKVGPYRGQRQPFGPFMVLGALIGALAGQEILGWYLAAALT